MRMEFATMMSRVWPKLCVAMSLCCVRFKLSSRWRKSDTLEERCEC